MGDDRMMQVSNKALWDDHSVPVAEKMPRDKAPHLTTVYDYQAQFWPWAVHNFGDERVTTAEEAVLGLVEEVGELCRAFIKRSQGVRGTHAEWSDEIRKELGDVFIKTLDVGIREGLDMEQTFYDRWQTIKQRDWRADRVGHGLPGDEA